MILNFYSIPHPKVNMLSTLRIVQPIYYTKKIFVVSITLNRFYKNVPGAPFTQFKVFVPGQLKLQKCYFRTTPRRDVPPIVAMLLRPVLRFSALVFGRTFKRWWNRKSPGEQEKYAGWFSSKSKLLFGIFGTLASGCLVYYIMHLETDPLTHRSRLIVFNKKQQDILAKLTFEMHLEEHRDHLVPRSHPSYDKLLKLTDRLLNANRDLAQVRDKHWTLTVVDQPLKNAYVLPGGNIFIFMGALDLVENEDQLSIIVAHEMAHALLQHSNDGLMKMELNPRTNEKRQECIQVLKHKDDHLIHGYSECLLKFSTMDSRLKACVLHESVMVWQEQMYQNFSMLELLGRYIPQMSESMDWQMLCSNLIEGKVEQVSNGLVVDILITVPIALIWAFFPDIIAGFVQLLGQQIVDVVHNLPYSRALEIEADEVGLTLAAKACVDVREAVVFWGMMRTLSELNAEPSQIPWLSTHPNHGDREKKLDLQTPGALAVRDRYGCSELDPVDPRKKFYERSRRENEARFKQRGII